LGARAKISGTRRERIISLEEFFLGPGETTLEADELLTEIQVPEVPVHTKGVYLKLKPRNAVGLALVGVAVFVTFDSKQTNIDDARIVLGAVAPTPIRAYKAEDVLKGKIPDDKLIEQAAQVASEEARPISDVRGSAEYRRAMVKVLTRQGIKQAVAA
jgi:carbon-monoxide dehydrogenase medium subunit